MPKLLDSLLSDIREGLHSNWMKAKKLSISKIVNAIPGADAGVIRNRKKQELTEAAAEEFDGFWINVANDISQQYEIFYTAAEESMLTRHPWIKDEQESSQISLKDIFLRQTLEHLLFDLLENKPPKATTWENIAIDPSMRFTWQAINPQSLAKQIEGYPLSDPKFYDDRLLPTYVQAPFSQSPQRYDLYRLIKKNYEASFKPKKLANGVVSTAMAPLHHTELAQLTPDEWNNFETIILNIGQEEDPEWVLLDKKKGNWTVYAPSFLESRCRNITELADFQFTEVRHLSHIVYDEKIDWHAVLLSRVLPWCRSSEAQKSKLDAFRATYPIPLLLQNTLEASCLVGQKKIATASQTAFSKRKPLSLLDANDLYAAELNSIPPATNYLLPNIPETAAANVITALDTGRVNYDPRENKISIGDPAQFVEAMKLAYYQRATKLEILVPFQESWKRWFEYNLDLTTIESLPNPEYSYAYACAARNHFLTKTDFFAKAKTIEAKQNAWEKTGSYIYQLFKNNPNPERDQIRNIAEMGTEGLDVFFHHINTVQKPALACTFDLNSGHTTDISEYILHLTDKIHSCKKRPLFTKLDLILPDELNESTQAALVALITELNSRTDLNSQDEISEINFHNPQGINPGFIKILKDLATANNIHLQIKIPTWDENVAATPQKGSLKADYRELQNVILGNIRETRESELYANTLSIHKPQSIRHLQRSSVAVEDESWHSDVSYKLASGGLGVQQQAQQEVAQEVQQESEQQTQPKAAEREIGKFTGEGDKLITRANVTIRGASEEDYSLWVGSNSDARFVIQGMDEAAFNKIREFPSLFKFGVDWKNTPGFRLTYLSDENKELILIYDEALVAEDIKDQKSAPFAIKMNYSKEAVPFYGDYRQLQRLAVPGADAELTLWHHLANENLSKAIKDWLHDHGYDPKTSESMQYNDVNKKLKQALNEPALINMIKDWSRPKLILAADEDPEAFLTALFGDFTPQNLQAFGQLFYHYDAKGSENWLQLAHKIYQKFPDHFYLYKKHLLNPLADWSECLEKNEVEALTASMQKLENYPAYQNILWALIDTHGNNVIANQDGKVTPMHFSEVWRAYNKIIDYIDANNLNIKEQEFLDAILQYQDQFNASQFLRRIYEVLQQVGNKPDSIQIQQEILDNLSAIDWRENGFYYACVYENYPYWDGSLALSGLQRLDNLKMSTYGVTWDNADLKISDELGFTLRYAAQRLQLSKAEFDKLKTTLTHIAQRHPKNNSGLFRLITTSIAIGLDTVDTIYALEEDVWAQLANPRYQDIIQAINQNLSLDSKDLISHSYHLRMSDLPILVEALSEIGLENLPALDLNIINALGRALQSFTGDKKSQMQELLQYGRQHGFDHPLITSYPWLVTNRPEQTPNNPEQLKFYEQLSSINFASSKLPTKEVLTNLIDKIHTAEDRHAAVAYLIEQECYITNQDADFRSLKSDEKRLIDGLYLSKTFGIQNRLLLKKLFERVAIKEEGNTHEKINKLLSFFSGLDKKNYYDELGQVLGLLVEKSRNNQYYSLEQLSTWLSTVFDADAFKTKPYPVPFIDALLTDALQDGNSSLINKDLHHLSTHEASLEPLQAILAHINLTNLPDRAKQSLVKTAVQFKHEGNLTQISERFEAIFSQQFSAQITTGVSDFINWQLKNEPNKLLQSLPMLERLTQPCRSQDEGMKLLWESNQIKLLDGLVKKTISDKNTSLLVNIENEPVRMILTAALSETDNDILIKMVQTQLINLKPNSDLDKLAVYYQTDPRPTLSQLNALLTQKKPVTDLITHYERVVQAEGKRVYSLSDDDGIDLKRVLNGFKLKGNRNLNASEQAGLLNLLYYTNNYSQIFKLEEKTNEELLDLINSNKKVNTDEAKARVLACMREIVLRKTGKWANHTQMLDLLYGAIHNDENLLHQIRTGEGKSIITLMRVAYRALNGQMIDVFSSKESLSVRDHHEFSPVYDAFHIRHNHITDKSKPDNYHNEVDENGIGAVHYATIGNFSLFVSGLSWEAKGKIALHAKNRVAFLDEGDHIMRFENTLFNFSDQTEGASVYNYDAWVYKVTHDFYKEHEALIKNQDFNVYEKPDLKLLYEKLQAASLAIAPDKSNFFQKYLASGDETLRNQKLLKLLTATHTAHGLEEGVHYSVMNDQKKISDSVTLDTRFAKVMINNQVYHGSTYSDLVQQSLHVLLNEKAIEKGERPNFFIEPESEIALSLNARYVLQNYYNQIEACTGTPGNEQALAFYKRVFGIDTVIKLPTHKEIQTKFLPPIYAPNEEEQVAAIVAAIREHPEQPILITCEDDKAVKRLGELIQQALGEERAMVLDTNAKGLSEAEIVKDAGKPGAITVSSRLGRGTDIKPFDHQLGLKVIRTYPASPEVEKQEKGRQGRNAAGGVCQDIINYAPIKEKLIEYTQDVRFMELLAQEREHLENKLIKHLGDNNEKWKQIREKPVLKDEYLNTRTVLRYRHELQEQSLQRMREKDDLIAEGSGSVIEHLYDISPAEEDQFKQAWKECKTAIELGWSEDLDGKKSRAILDEFYKKYKVEPVKAVQKVKSEKLSPRLQGNADVRIEDLIAFHQQWLIGMSKFGLSQDLKLVTTLYSENGAQFDKLHQAFNLLNTEQIATFSDLVKKFPNSSHSVSSETWVAAIDLLANNEDIAETYSTRVYDFFAKNPAPPKTVDGVKAYSKLFLAAVSGAPNIEFIQDIIRDVYPVKQHEKLLEKVNTWPRGLVDLCKNNMTQEDIVFILNNILVEKAYEPRCKDYLGSHTKALKAAPYMIRPLIGLLFEKNLNMAVLDTLDYSQKTAGLLNFFNQRPGYTSKDYKDMSAKVDRIVKEEDQLAFLSWLSAIPPYIPASTVIKDLIDLPGMHGFDNGGVAVQKRLHRIEAAATAFNNFLFDHGLITSKDSFATPINDDLYKNWCGIYSSFPTLEKREQFFTTVSKLSHIEISTLKRLANSYSEDLSTESLSTEANKLLQAKKTDIPTIAIEDSALNQEGLFGGRSRRNSGF